MKHTIKRLVCALLVMVIIASFVPVLSVSAATAGSRLKGLDKTVYDQFMKLAVAVSSGSQTSTEFTLSEGIDALKWTKEDLGVSAIIADGKIAEDAKTAMNNKLNEIIHFTRVINGVMDDHPYELFWYDKITGTRIIPKISATDTELKITAIEFHMAVSVDYAAGAYTVDAAKIKAANKAANNAKAIVAKYASKSDVEKLMAYKDEICKLTDYNYSVENNSSVPYGNPWQMISVFDNDPGTKAVCEGYAKAFQYLCQLSDFKGDVVCYLVNGYMQGGTGEGNHTWNVVLIDGGTLMVDVTNCDDGTVGAPDQLFLKVGQKNKNTYVFNAGGAKIYYTYDVAEYDMHTDGYLELNQGNFQETPATEPTAPPTEAPTAPTPAVTLPVATQPSTAAPTVPKATKPPATTPVTIPATKAPTVPVATAPKETEPAATVPTVKPTEPAQVQSVQVR